MADPSLIPAKSPKKRGPGRQFQKGQSGNPNGRPKLPPEVRERAQHYGPEMIDVLHSLATDTEQTGAVRVAAANSVLNRGFGRPIEPILTASKEPTLLELIEAAMARSEERNAAALTIEHSNTQT